VLIRRSSGIVFYRFRDPGLVRGFEQTFFFAAQLALRSRLDSPLYPDGDRRGSCLASRAKKSAGPVGARSIPYPADLERIVVFPFFRASLSSFRARGYFVPLGDDLGYNNAIFQGFDPGRSYVDPVPSLGDIRKRPEPRDLSFKPLTGNCAFYGMAARILFKTLSL